MSDLVNKDGFLLRVNEYEKSIILRDIDFNGNNLNDSVVEYIKEAGIKDLELNDVFGFNLNTLQFLIQVSWVEGLRIIKSGGINLEGLQLLKNLKRITINYSSESLDFSHFKKLKIADILWSKERITILECESLETLVLHKYNGEGLEKITNLPTLKNLKFVSSSINNLKGVENLKNLETIEIHYNSKLSDLSILAKCKTLKKIRLSNLSKVTNLNFLANCESVEFISVSDCKNIIENESLFKCESLKVIGYYNSGSIATINGIEHLKYLERFNIGNTNVEDGNLKPLLRLENITTISFKDKRHYNLKLEEVKNKLHT